MNRKTLLLTAAAALVIFLGLEYYPGAQPAEFIGAIGAESGNGKADLHEEGFSREVCEQDCGEKYGVAAVRSDEARSRLYALCMQECERQFWKKLDRRTKELEREEK